MLWLTETHSPDHPLWTDTTSSILTALSQLLQKLHSYFQRSYMPYYFIPSINILQRIPLDVTSKVSLMIFRIQYLRFFHRIAFNLSRTIYGNLVPRYF